MDDSVMKFTNIKGRGDDFQFVPDTPADESSLFDGGGSYSTPEIIPDRPVTAKAPPSGDLVSAVQASWEDRDSFKQEVFKNIGGDPFTINVDDEISKFATSGGYEDMFNEFFDGHISWRNRNRMSPHQKEAWNRMVLQEHAHIERETSKKKKQMHEQYNYMMGEWDARAKDILGAKKTVAASREKEEKARRVSLEKQIKDQKTLSKAEKTAGVASLRKLADNTKGYSQEEMTFYSKPDTKGKSFAVDKTPLEIQEMNMDAKRIGEPGFVAIQKDGETFYPRVPHLSEETTADEIRRYGKEFQEQNPDLWAEYKKALSQTVIDAVADGTVSREKADEWFGRKTAPAEQVKAPEGGAEKTMEESIPGQGEEVVAEAAKGIEKQIKDALDSLPEQSKNEINKMFAKKISRAKNRKDKLKVQRQMLKKIKWVAKQPGSAAEAEREVPYKGSVFADR